MSEVNLPKIILGPLLGYENEGWYTVCVLLDKAMDAIQCHFSNEQEIITIGHSYYSKVREYYFYRFEVNLINWQSKSITYWIGLNEQEKLATINDIHYWSFNIPDFESQAQIAFISCSGMHSKYPTDINPKYFLGWKQLLDHKPDYMILTGDQVYADTIFKKVKNTKYFVDTGICLFTDDEIDDFYLHLYIDSWSNKYMARALAEIPNIMTWDDHDIIDGYGSYSKPYFNRLDIFFKYASKYFELFQIRTINNKLLIDKNSIEKERKDFSQIVILGYNLYVLPDTRSQRSWKKILNQSQYKRIEEKLKLYKSTLNFNLFGIVLPVPIAHRDYSSYLEKYSSIFLDKILKFGMATDDLIDHWDHDYHKPEQKVMMDFIFRWGKVFNSKYILIVSGDVHASGAATITKTSCLNEQTYATQLVSSPMVNKSSSFMGKFSDYFSNAYKTFDIYSCHLLSFGNYSKNDIYKRNFMILKENDRSVLCAFLHMESNKGWTDEIEDQKISRTLKKRILPTNLSE